MRMDDVGRRFGDVSLLPLELVQQLKTRQTDSLHKHIQEVMLADFDGVATIDEILVGLFRNHKTLHNRDQIARKVYRMVRKGQLGSVMGRRGVYRLPTTSDE